jgi:hypothetical protein
MKLGVMAAEGDVATNKVGSDIWQYKKLNATAVYNICPII